MADIVSVHLVNRQAMLEDGQVIPIVNLMDEEGEDTQCPRAAKALVAGPCKDGRWYADMVDIFNVRASVN